MASGGGAWWGSLEAMAVDCGCCDCICVCGCWGSVFNLWSDVPAFDVAVGGKGQVKDICFIWQHTLKGGNRVEWVGVSSIGSNVSR